MPWLRSGYFRHGHARVTHMAVGVVDLKRSLHDDMKRFTLQLMDRLLRLIQTNKGNVTSTSDLPELPLQEELCIPQENFFSYVQYYEEFKIVNVILKTSLLPPSTSSR